MPQRDRDMKRPPPATMRRGENQSRTACPSLPRASTAALCCWGSSSRLPARSSLRFFLDAACARLSTWGGVDRLSILRWCMVRKCPHALPCASVWMLPAHAHGNACHRCWNHIPACRGQVPSSRRLHLEPVIFLSHRGLPHAGPPFGLASPGRPLFPGSLAQPRSQPCWRPSTCWSRAAPYACLVRLQSGSRSTLLQMAQVTAILAASPCCPSSRACLTSCCVGQRMMVLALMQERR